MTTSPASNPKWTSLCESDGHIYLATTSGVTNRCAYCGERKQALNFGPMQVRPNPTEFLEMKEALK